MPAPPSLPVHDVRGLSEAWNTVGNVKSFDGLSALPAYEKSVELWTAANDRLGMGLGARARDPVRMVLPGTSWIVGAGCWQACSCVWFSTTSPDRELARSSDPWWRTVLLLAVAVVARLAPARRAASIDPTDAVRHEQPRRTQAAPATPNAEHPRASDPSRSSCIGSRSDTKDDI